jgi:hypothetical protein
VTSKEVVYEHDRYIENLVKIFSDELNAIAHSAQAKVTGVLVEKLKTTDGQIDVTAANRAILRRIDKMFADAMESAGYDQLVGEFVNSFQGQLPYFDQLLESISQTLKTPLVAKWEKSDLAAFAGQQAATMDTLLAVVDGAAVMAKRKALMNVNALSFKDLVEEIGSVFGRTVPESVGLAETSAAAFFRTVSDRGYQHIEESLPEGALKYRYEGPLDKLTRPWCRHTLTDTAAHSVTRAQIDKMDNGSSLSNPWFFGGGWRCRHQWILVGIS